MKLQYLRHARGVAGRLAVHEPEARGHGGGEGDHVAGEGQLRRARDVLPVRGRRAARDRAQQAQRRRLL